MLSRWRLCLRVRRTIGSLGRSRLQAKHAGHLISLATTAAYAPSHRTSSLHCVLAGFSVEVRRAAGPSSRSVIRREEKPDRRCCHPAGDSSRRSGSRRYCPVRAGASCEARHRAWPGVAPRLSMRLVASPGSCTARRAKTLARRRSFYAFTYWRVRWSASTAKSSGPPAFQSAPTELRTPSAASLEPTARPAIGCGLTKT